MDCQEALELRLAAQHISAWLERPEEVLRSMGAMQAQDYKAALWAIGLRCREGTTAAEIENAVSKRMIARTWLMRGTIHFAASKDIPWMLKLFAPRLLRTAMQRDQHLGLSNGAVERAKKAFCNALVKERQLTRSEMYALLEKEGIPSKNNLGYHMLYRAAWDGLICFGPSTGEEQTFVLLEEHVGKGRELEGKDALGELARRYFTSHGPATIRDYVWWSGLTVKDAKAGIEKAGKALRKETIDGVEHYMQSERVRPGRRQAAYLLPAFDEYLVGYAERGTMLGGSEAGKGPGKPGKKENMRVVHSNGTFVPVVVAGGKVAGRWGRKLKGKRMAISVKPFIRLEKDAIASVKDEVERYGRFFGIEASLDLI